MGRGTGCECIGMVIGFDAEGLEVGRLGIGQGWGDGREKPQAVWNDAFVDESEPLFVAARERFGIGDARYGLGYLAPHEDDRRLSDVAKLVDASGALPALASWIDRHNAPITSMRYSRISDASMRRISSLMRGDVRPRAIVRVEVTIA